MSLVRPPVAAGSFYPASPVSLRATVERYLELAPEADVVPKALIVPHAGYVYSGPVAAAAYTAVRSRRDAIERVILVGPAHFLKFQGLAASAARGFATPLGVVSVDRTAVDLALKLPGVHVRDEAHAPEHSLEVQLPFLQIVLSDFEIVPLLVGQADAGEVGRVLDVLWGGDETLLVISSDLSHYHEYSEARSLDQATARTIQSLDVEHLFPEQACGALAICGLLEAGRRRGLEVQPLYLANSGDTAGSRREVGGYGAFALAQPVAAVHQGGES